MPPSPDALFQIATPFVVLGWIALIVSPLTPRWADRAAALLVPVVLSIAYTALILAHWSGAAGGFSTLPQVMQLFTNSHIALAGWLHYLAFDLFIGAWITRTARAEGIPHAAVLPCLGLTFMFGPAGFLAFTILRTIQTMRRQTTGATL